MSLVSCETPWKPATIAIAPSSSAVAQPAGRDVDDPGPAVHRGGEHAGLRAGVRPGLVPEVVDRHRQQRHRDALAGGEQHVQLAAGRQRADLVGQVHQLVGGVAHRGDHDDHVVAGLAGGDDALRHPLDALGRRRRTNRRTSAPPAPRQRTPSPTPRAGQSRTSLAARVAAPPTRDPRIRPVHRRRARHARTTVARPFRRTRGENVSVRRSLRASPLSCSPAGLAACGDAGAAQPHADAPAAADRAGPDAGRADRPGRPGRAGARTTASPRSTPCDARPASSATVVATVATDGSWRVDIPGGALGGTADVSIVQTAGGRLPVRAAVGRPTRSTPAASGSPTRTSASPRSTTRRCERVFRQWLNVFTDRQAALSVVPAAAAARLAGHLLLGRLDLRLAEGAGRRRHLLLRRRRPAHRGPGRLRHAQRWPAPAGRAADGGPARPGRRRRADGHGEPATAAGRPSEPSVPSVRPGLRRRPTIRAYELATSELIT